MNKNYKFISRLFSCLIVLAGINLTTQSQNAWINEIHYDDASTDTLEMVEVVIENPGNYTLSSFQIILYNGSNGTTYTPTYNLSEFTVGYTYGNFTIYSRLYPVNGIQNGNPDGLALVYSGAVISGQFLSYEGTFSATNGPAIGTTSISIGVAEAGTEPAGFSLQLSGSGSQNPDFTWQAPATATVGALNNGQTLISGGVDNPMNFNAVTFSQTQIDLSWTQNTNFDDVMVATNSTNSFGTPSGTYDVNDTLGTATVIYNGSVTLFSHTGLTNTTEYFYKAWSVDGSNHYSLGVVDSATTQFLEPSSHPSGLTATTNGPVFITVSWTDSDAAHYLIKGSNIGYNNIFPPFDGGIQVDSLLVKNVNASIQSQVFTGLNVDSIYYFKIYPYNGAGESSNYKTDGTVPQATATTEELDLNLIISEVADPLDNVNTRFVEIMNTGANPIDFAVDPVYLCKQANAGITWNSIALTGSLAAGATYVVAYSVNYFDTAYNVSANQYAGLVANFNGDDGVFLYYGGNNQTGILFDAFGEINVLGDTTAWYYENGHAVRNRGVISSNNVWTAEEWAIVRNVNYDNMTPFLHAEDVTWQGTSSANWNTRGNNWSGIYGFVPDGSCKITIPNATNYPVVTEPSACHEVQIQSGSTLSVQSTGSLLILGR